jgi:hypothetical protein
LPSRLLLPPQPCRLLLLLLLLLTAPLLVWQAQEAQALLWGHQQLQLVLLVDPCLCLRQPAQACMPCCQCAWQPWAS